MGRETQAQAGIGLIHSEVRSRNGSPGHPVLRSPPAGDVVGEEDAAGERFDREESLPGRNVGSDVERGDVPVFDRAHRDSSV